ncbi:MAG: hypothetical protein K2N52_00810 [Clostridia bacterium]|nr:hypothetical protein [Clostridia bacterium]
MEDKRKKCWSCTHYRAYYTKKLCHFEKENCGYCLTHKQIITDKHHTCDEWCLNAIRRRIRKDVSLKALNETLGNLVEIRQILVEEINDNEIYPLN